MNNNVHQVKIIKDSRDMWKTIRVSKPVCGAALKNGLNKIIKVFLNKHLTLIIETHSNLKYISLNEKKIKN